MSLDVNKSQVSFTPSTKNNDGPVSARQTTSSAIAAAMAGDVKNIPTESLTEKGVNRFDKKVLGDVTTVNGVSRETYGDISLSVKKGHIAESGGITPEGRQFILNTFREKMEGSKFADNYDPNTLKIKYSSNISNNENGTFYFSCEKKSDPVDSDAKDHARLYINTKELIDGSSSDIDSQLCKIFGVDKELTSTLTQQISQKDSLISDKNKEVGNLQSKVSELNSRIGQLQKQIGELHVKDANSSDAMTALKERLSTAVRKKDALDGQVAQLNKEIGGLKQDKAHLEREKASLTQNNLELKGQVSELEQQISGHQALREGDRAAIRKMADDGKRSYGWAASVATISVAIAGVITAIASIAVSKGKDRAEEADGDIENAQSDLSDAENGDYKAEGLQAKQDLIAQDALNYSEALKNGDDKTADEIKSRYLPLPDGNTLDFSIDGLSPEGESYMQPFVDTAVSDARDQAVERANTSLSNAQKNKSSAELTEKQGIAALAGGVPLALGIGGMIAGLNALHVHKKNKAVAQNLNKIENGDYNHLQSMKNVGFDIKHPLRVFA